MMAPIALEKLTRDDIPGAKDLIAEAVLEFYGDLVFLPKTKEALLEHYGKIGYLADIDAFETEYGEGNGAFFVLKDDGRICGCGGIKRLDGSRGELARLWLKKEFRQKGHGRMVFEAVMRAAEECGFEEVFLDTSARCADAVRLFRRNGFADCPKYKESIGDIFLRKRMRA